MEHLTTLKRNVEIKRIDEIVRILAGTRPTEELPTAVIVDTIRFLWRLQDVLKEEIEEGKNGNNQAV